MKKHLFYTFLTVIASVLSAVGLYVFVYPARFAPSGIDGIATMLQDLVGWNAGYFSLMINLPLLIIAWFFLDRKYVIYTVVFIVISSLLLILFEHVDFYQYNDIDSNGYLIAAIFSGVILGTRTGIMLKFGASSGGVDIIACIVQVKTNYQYVEKLISIFCYVIIAISFFVYRNLNCILLSVVQMFVFERSSSHVLKEKRSAVEFKIITTEPESVKNDIIYTLKHGATIVESRGMYTDNQSTMIFTVVNNRQVSEFFTLMKKHPNTFIYYTDVRGVKGNFRYMKNDEIK